MSDAARQRVLRRAALVSRATAYLAVWAVLAAAAGLALFLLSSRTVVLASHDAVLRPNLHGQVVVHTGPVLPDFRIGSGGRVGVDIRLGKTDAESTEALVERYAFIASQPEGQIAKVRDALVDMALAAALRGAVLGLLPILVWLLIGAARRRELAARARSPGGAVAALARRTPRGPAVGAVGRGREQRAVRPVLGAAGRVRGRRASTCPTRRRGSRCAAT